MVQASLWAERVLFSPQLPEVVDRLLQEAVAATQTDPALAQRLFIQARQLDGSCLQTYFALYKFYFHCRRLQEAERVVASALEEASRQGHFPCDHTKLAQQPELWDMYATDITLFYLFIKGPGLHQAAQWL